MKPNQGACGCCLRHAALVLHPCAMSWHQDYRRGGLSSLQRSPEGIAGFTPASRGLVVLEDMQLLVGMLPWHPLPTSLACAQGRHRRSGGKDPAIPSPSRAAPGATRLRAESPHVRVQMAGGEAVAPPCPGLGVSAAFSACCDMGTSPPWLGVRAAPRCSSPWTLARLDPNPALGAGLAGLQEGLSPAPSCLPEPSAIWDVKCLLI